MEASYLIPSKVLQGKISLLNPDLLLPGVKHRILVLHDYPRLVDILHSRNEKYRAVEQYHSPHKPPRHIVLTGNSGIIRKGDKFGSMSPLNPTQDLEITATTSLSDHPFKGLQDLAPLLRKEPGLKSFNRDMVNNYFRPRASNLEAIDAFSVVSFDKQDWVVLLQMTITESHPVSTNGLDAVWEIIPNTTRKRKFIFVFVRPEEEQTEFQEQPLGRTTKLNFGRRTWSKLSGRSRVSNYGRRKRNVLREEEVLYCSYEDGVWRTACCACGCGVACT